MSIKTRLFIMLQTIVYQLDTYIINMYSIDIQTYNIVEWLVYNQTDSNKQIATNRQQQPDSNNQTATTRQQQTDSNKQTATNRQQQTDSNEQTATTRQQQPDSNK